jgi:hypothetical protein
VSTLAVILDIGFILSCGTNSAAVTRRAVGDPTNDLDMKPLPCGVGPLDEPAAQHLCEAATHSGRGNNPIELFNWLAAIRTMREAYLRALSKYLLMAVPAWLPARDAMDNWETTARKACTNDRRL